MSLTCVSFALETSRERSFTDVQIAVCVPQMQDVVSPW